MARYEVRCEVRIPDEIQVTDQEVKEWAKFSLLEAFELKDNPLGDLDFMAMPGTVEVNGIR